MRQVIVAGNWKMNASKETVNTLIMGILSGMAEVDSTVIVCAPSPYMSQVEALITHSQLHGETDEVVADKVQAALDNDLKPLFCIGETLEEREVGNMEAVVSRQIQAVIDRVGIGAFKDVIIAYEPV